MKYLLAVLGSYLVSYGIAALLTHGKVEDLVEERQLLWPEAEIDGYRAQLQASVRQGRWWFCAASGSLMALVVSGVLWLIG